MKRIERISISYGSFASNGLLILQLHMESKDKLDKEKEYVYPIFRLKLILLGGNYPLKISDVKNDWIGIDR
jgi:hypothetical protein